MGSLPPRLGLYTAVLQQRLLALRPAPLGAVGVALRPVAVLLVGPRPHAGPRVLGDEQRHQQGQQHRTGAEEEGGARNDGALERRNRRLLGCVRRHAWGGWVGVEAHLVCGVRHVDFGAFPGAVRVVQLHVEKVEDKAVKSRPQTVTEPPDSCDHPLDNTWMAQVAQHGYHGYRQSCRSSDAALKQTAKPLNFQNLNADRLTLLVGVGVSGNDGADGGEGDAGHGCHGACCPHHPAGRTNRINQPEKVSM